MPAVTLDTRTDIKGTPSAKFGTFDLKTSTTAGGWKISGTVTPATPTFTKNGMEKFSAAAPEVNVEVTDNDGLTVFFDNLQLLPEQQFAPRFKVAKKVTIADSTYACDATYIMKGNTSDKCKPSAKDVLKLNCKAPAVSGFTPTMKYSTGNDTATLEIAGAVDKANVTLKGDFDVANMSKKSLSATVAYPLPEGVKAKVEIKDDKSGKIELAKDKFTLEAPIKAGFTAPSANDLTLKIKFSKDFEM